MINITGIPGRTTEVDGKEYLFFSGFAYLGMPSLSAFQNWITEGAQKYGAVFPSSRISNTRLELYEIFEEKLSASVGLPASASFSSGYMASQAAVTFAAQNSILLYSPGIHPSLKLSDWPASKVSSVNWRQPIIDQVNTQKNSSFTIIMESINPLTGNIHDFSWLSQLQNPVRVLIDDSHGIGILGAGGEGVISLLPKHPNLRYLICYSLAKAFSCEGGAISGEKGDISEIKKLPYFTAATAMSPAFVHAWLEACYLFAKQRKQLKENIAYFNEKITDIRQIHHDTQLPVYRITSSPFYEHCLKYHILLSAFRYPSKQDPLMSRIVLNALHTHEDLERLKDCIKAFFPLEDKF